MAKINKMTHLKHVFKGLFKTLESNFIISYSTEYFKANK